MNDSHYQHSQRNHMLEKIILWGAIISCSFSPGLIFAQSNAAGSIFGQVTLEGGQPASEALITIVNDQTGLQKALPARADGSFRFSALPIGTYSVLIETNGYIAIELKSLAVNVGVGTNTRATLTRVQEDVVELDILSVVGGKISPIDTSSVESSSVFTTEMISNLPVQRNLAGVALLAPGTTRGDADFGGEPLISFGGASIAENVFYVNGMNVTNFRNGLGGSTVPFEFFQEFQVKTGGYGAEFGRSTGGVINSVTKSGGNEFHFGAGAYYEPDNWRKTSPDVPATPGDPTWPFDNYLEHSGDEQDLLNIHAYGSGYIVQDRVFFYAMISHQRTEEHDGEPFGFTTGDFDNTFWGVKLDAQITPNHLLEFTAFSDQRTRETFDTETFQGFVDPIGFSFSDRGGQTYVLRYTGFFGSAFTLSALAGTSRYDRTDRNEGENCPVILDTRPGAADPFLGCWLSFDAGKSNDERDMFRVDGEWDFGTHLLRFGADYEKNKSYDSTRFSGDVYWRYFNFGPGFDVVRERIRFQDGGWEVENTAYYVEDHWQVTNTLMLYGGLRLETFDNKNEAGETFVKMNEQLAPRLGFSWDVRGDGKSKLFGTAGRYHLPMPTHVNVNLSGALFFSEEWLVLLGTNPDGSPIKGPQLPPEVIGPENPIIYSDGTIPNTDELIDHDLDPGYQDEFILGYEFVPAQGWSLGFRLIYRDLKQSIEDVDMSRALNSYAAENGYEEFFRPLFSTYVLTNPGHDASLMFDLDGDGVAEQVMFSADDLGVPKAKRTYKAAEIFFEKVFDGNWLLQGSYTYSESRGNYEGWTRSDVNESGAALGSAFDIPELMEGARGRLVNDRPHTLKLFGAWDFTPRWLVSGNFLFQSGRPYGAIGFHPELPSFIDSAFYSSGVLTPRGSLGRTDDIKQLDLGIQYRFPFNYRNGEMQLRLDVFNVFNSDSETELHEQSESQNFGEIDHHFLTPTSFQQPRFVRISARFDF
jgi:hypothetical protein